MQSLYKSVLLFLVLYQVTTKAIAQINTHQGKEFWLGFSAKSLDTISNEQNVTLYLGGSSQNATVTISIDSSGLIPATWYKKVYTIQANSFITADNIPNGPKGSNPSFDARIYGEDTFRKKGIHIQSDVPISAFLHQYGSVSAGLTMLLPTNNWGFAYSTLNSEQIDAAGPANSFVYVIAKDDNTKIQITPSVLTKKQKQAGIPFIVGLQKGQIYQIISQTDASGNGGQFTGTTVTSITGSDNIVHPIAVFSGSTKTRGETIPCGTSSGRDNDIQQLIPLQSLGLKYLTSPLSTGSGTLTNPIINANQFQTSVYKIIVPHSGTIVKRNGTVLTNIINGQYYQYSSSTADFIEADQPILVGQFISGSSTCNPGSFGDPDMIILTPLEQSIKEVSFVRTNAEAIKINYATIIVPTSGLNSLRFDNSSLYNYSYIHPQKPDYTIVIKGWLASKSTSSIKCDSPFVCINYGLGGAESYACSVGNSDSISPAFHRTSSLPLKLENFQVKHNKNSNILQWLTDQEVNVYCFELERSYNSKDFTFVGKIIAGKKNYQFVDECSNTSIVYYRLKIRNNDGSIQYSHIISVKNTEKFSFQIFPNPIKNVLNISFNSEKKLDVFVQIISLSGKILFTKEVSIKAGSTLSTLYIQTLPKGNYFLQSVLRNKEKSIAAFEKL